MIPLWCLLFGMAVAYALGIWIGWTGRKFYKEAQDDR